MGKINQNLKEIVIRGLRELSLFPEDHQIDALVFHTEEMLKWNKTTNLTSITHPEEVAVKHIVDSAVLSTFCSEYTKILDIGTGAGFPGIPLKILLPDTDITLIETVRKKVSFLKHVIRSLKLDRIKAIQARGEEQSRLPEYNGQFDAVVCRAFAGLDTFVNMAVPYLKEDGVIFAMKGREKEQETAFLKRVETTLFDGRKITCNDLDVEIKEYQLPVVVSERAVFIIKLIKQG